MTNKYNSLKTIGVYTLIVVPLGYIVSCAILGGLFFMGGAQAESKTPLRIREKMASFAMGSLIGSAGGIMIPIVGITERIFPHKKQ